MIHIYWLTFFVAALLCQYLLGRNIEPKVRPLHKRFPSQLLPGKFLANTALHAIGK